MVQHSVQLNLSVNLAGGKDNSKKKNRSQTVSEGCFGGKKTVGAVRKDAAARLPSPAGEVWRRARVG